MNFGFCPRYNIQLYLFLHSSRSFLPTMLCGRDDVSRKLCSMLDLEDSAEHKIGSSFPKFFLLPLAMLIVVGALLFLVFSASEQKENNFYSFKVVNIRGKLVSLDKYRGSVSLRRREPPICCHQLTSESSRHACMTDGEKEEGALIWLGGFAGWMS